MMVSFVKLLDKLIFIFSTDESLQRIGSFVI
jgi:hypothetical protein